MSRHDPAVHAPGEHENALRELQELERSRVALTVEVSYNCHVVDETQDSFALQFLLLLLES